MLPQPVFKPLAAIVRGFLIEVAEAVEAALKLACTFPRFHAKRFAPDVPAPMEMRLGLDFPARAGISAPVFAVRFGLNKRDARVGLARRALALDIAALVAFEVEPEAARVVAFGIAALVVPALIFDIAAFVVRGRDFDIAAVAAFDAEPEALRERRERCRCA
jgi:hypothetical protein